MYELVIDRMNRINHHQQKSPRATLPMETGRQTDAVSALALALLPHVVGDAPMYVRCRGVCAAFENGKCFPFSNRDQTSRVPRRVYYDRTFGTKTRQTDRQTDAVIALEAKPALLSSRNIGGCPDIGISMSGIEGFAPLGVNPSEPFRPSERRVGSLHSAPGAEFKWIFLL